MAIFDDRSAALAAYPVTDVGEHSRSEVRVTNTPHRRALVALAAALAVSFGAMQEASAAPNCKPDIFVKNNKDKAIKVLRFKYKVKDRAGTFDEGLANKRLAPGETGDWDKVALQEAAIGNVITSTWVEYRDDTSGVGDPVGDPWGPARLSPEYEHDDGYECQTDRNYWLGVDDD